jgi:hypothetical protein
VDGDDELRLNLVLAGGGCKRGDGDGEGGGAGEEEVATPGHFAVAADLLSVDEDAEAAAEVLDGEAEVLGVWGNVNVDAVPDLIEVEEHVHEHGPGGIHDLPILLDKGGRGEVRVAALVKEPGSGKVEPVAEGRGLDAMGIDAV